MAHIQYMDELIREYLLYRGFTSTLKNFEQEVKSEKEKGFRVDKIVDQILSFVYAYDLSGLKEIWTHFETKLFSKLEHHLTIGVKKLENSMYKFYLVHAISNGKNEKVVEFFAKTSQDIQNQSEWRDWFLLPFIKSPEDNSNFSVYFTKQWQDTFIVSLHNFLATIFQCMPLPTLANYDGDVNKLRKLKEENEFLRHKLSQMMEQSSKKDRVDIAPLDMPENQQLYDDLFIIAHEKNAESQVKTLRDIIRQIGASASPVKHTQGIDDRGRLKNTHH